jgi:hypothetical protein
VTDPLTAALRRICLALPESIEKQAWGDPTWRIRDRIFAKEKRGDGRVSVGCKAPAGMQEVQIGADPQHFFVPPHVGPKGWVGMRLDADPDWGEVAALNPSKRPADRAAAPGRHNRLTKRARFR